MSASVKAGAKGIVHAGTGMGSIHCNAYPAIEQAAKQGVVVVRSNRTGSGFVDADSTWKSCLTADNLNPQKARVLLQVALTQTQDPKKIQEMFDKF